MEEHVLCVKYSGCQLKQFHDNGKRRKRKYWINIVFPDGQVGNYVDHIEKPYTGRKLKELLKKTVKLNYKVIDFNPVKEKPREVDEEDYIPREDLMNIKLGKGNQYE